MTLHTLDSIRLERFITMYLGDASMAVAEGTADDGRVVAEAAARMINDYLRIVGGRAVAAELARENEALKLRMRDVCLRAARALVDAGDTEAALGVLRAAGVGVEAGTADMIRTRIDGVMAQDAYRRDKAKAQKDAQKEVKVTREYWTRERVAVMRWARMYVDERQISAAEYAYMVRAMCDDMQRVMNERNKRKKK